MAKIIMIQGTMSSAGKSFIVAGLCRIFKQDGYRVAPFKSQNMALNSYITETGLEMGRAQAMQAEAAGVTPSVFMNPILLKPTSDTGSQVIVMGEVQKNMSAREYFAYKNNLRPIILEAFQTLEKEYDIIVIEGAGSPAEINLKEEDIVNMGMAQMAKSPVLLVGDIDRGGVFAQLYGTYHLLEKEEQSYIKGFIINKFRGDKTILDSGVTMLWEKMNVPIVGVTPFLQIDLEEEDGASDHFQNEKKDCLLDIVVVRFPHISNFTDFLVFEMQKEVSVRYITSIKEMGNPDLIFLPGTKNTMADLRWLRECGLECEIQKQRQHGTILFGICGGFQMLGNRISDPFMVEEGGDVMGMGILPMNTIFGKKKVRTRVSGAFEKMFGEFQVLSGIAVEGYEIHMGVMETEELQEGMIQVIDQVTGTKKTDGLQKDNVLGSYIHGLFDQDEVVNRFLKILADKKGINLHQNEHFSYQKYKENQYEKLASELRKHLNMNQIYEILEKGM